MKKLTQHGGFQGDVVIIPVGRFPRDAQPTKNRKIALGESTGHYHHITGNVDVRETNTDFYFTVVPGEAGMIEHFGGDHETIEITPGIVWRVPKYSQREYDGENERRALDQLWNNRMDLKSRWREFCMVWGFTDTPMTKERE